jgi:hypothetical protein
MYVICHFFDLNLLISEILTGTGKIQPNDVGIQWIFKHIIKVEAANWFMQETQKQLKAKPNVPVKLPTEIGPFRDATVGWVCKAAEYFKSHPEVVKDVSP